MVAAFWVPTVSQVMEMDQQKVVMSMTAVAPQRGEPLSRDRESTSVEEEKSSFSNELEGAMERGAEISPAPPGTSSDTPPAADGPAREAVPDPAGGQALAAVVVAVAPPGQQQGEPIAISGGERATTATDTVVPLPPPGWRAPSGRGTVAVVAPPTASAGVDMAADAPPAGSMPNMAVLDEGVSQTTRRATGNERMLAELARQNSSPEGMTAGRGDGGAVPPVSLGGDSVQVAVTGVGGASSRPDAAAAAQANALPRFLAVDVPFNDPRWQGDFSQRVALMARAGNGQAEIKLNPAHLGPVEVRISINEDQQASVTFFAKHGAVREAIEASLPRLREMFATQGLELTGGSVSEQAPGPRGEGRRGRDGGGEGRSGNATTDATVDEAVSTERVSQPVVVEGGGVDLYV